MLNDRLLDIFRLAIRNISTKSLVSSIISIFALACIHTSVSEEATSTPVVPEIAPEVVPEIAPELIFLPGGSFMIGSLAHAVAQPVHEVFIAPFYIARFETTYNEFDLFSKATSRDLRHDIGWGRGNRPVVDVSWHEANAYAEWLSKQTGDVYRLPTEAEWEYAARGGEVIARFHWGNNTQTNKANCRDCGSIDGGISTSVVGEYEPNAFGLYDVHGNVWEMVQNCYSHSYFEKTEPVELNPDEDCKVIVVRGGSWETNSDELAVWFRGAYLKDSVSSDVGFRLVREPSDN